MIYFKIVCWLNWQKYKVVSKTKNIMEVIKQWNIKKEMIPSTSYKNPAYGRQRISRPMWIVAPMLFVSAAVATADTNFVKKIK